MHYCCGQTFLRNLPEPLLTFSRYSKLIEAGKCDNYQRRLHRVHRYLKSVLN